MAAYVKQDILGITPKDHTDRYRSVLDNILKSKGDELIEGLQRFIESIMNDNVSPVISRQLLTEVGNHLTKLPDDVSKEVSHYTLDKVQPRMVSFDEQVASICQHLAYIYEKENSWREAANVLVGIPLETGQKQFSVEYKLDTYLKIARLYLEDDDSVQAETYVIRASLLQAESRDEHDVAPPTCDSVAPDSRTVTKSTESTPDVEDKPACVLCIEPGMPVSFALNESLVKPEEVPKRKLHFTDKNNSRLKQSVKKTILGKIGENMERFLDASGIFRPSCTDQDSPNPSPELSGLHSTDEEEATHPNKRMRLSSEDTPSSSGLQHQSNAAPVKAHERKKNLSLSSDGFQILEQFKKKSLYRVKRKTPGIQFSNFLHSRKVPGHAASQIYIGTFDGSYSPGTPYEKPEASIRNSQATLASCSCVNPSVTVTQSAIWSGLSLFQPANASSTSNAMSASNPSAQPAKPGGSQRNGGSSSGNGGATRLEKVHQGLKCVACENSTPEESGSNPPATWECSSCCIRNSHEATKCVTCETPKTQGIVITAKESVPGRSIEFAASGDVKLPSDGVSLGEFKTSNASSPPPMQVAVSSACCATKKKKNEKKKYKSVSKLPRPIQDLGHLRPVAIDGSNIARTHGSIDNTFSCKGIAICVDYFLQRGHRKVLVFLPHFRKSVRLHEGVVTLDIEVLENLEKDHRVVYTPSRKVGERLIASYDDRFIITFASCTGAVIVSNDNFRDLMGESDVFMKTIHERLLMYVFIDDILMFPEDPLGRHGPSLDEFLSFPHPTEEAQNNPT